MDDLDFAAPENDAMSLGLQNGVLLSGHQGFLCLTAGNQLYALQRVFYCLYVLTFVLWALWCPPCLLLGVVFATIVSSVVFPLL